MNKQVYLNQFNGPHEHNLLPLAAGMLSAFVRGAPHLASYDIHIEVRRVSPQAAVARYRNPEVIAFSCYLWNYKYSMAVAALAKHRFPRALVIAGGPSIPRKHEALLHFFACHPYIDIAVAGEGELTFAEILTRHLSQDGFADVPGLAFRHDGHPQLIQVNAPRERLHDLDILPSPFLTGIFDEVMAEYGDIITGAVWESNRGCPFSCTFCDWGQAIQSRVAIFGQDRLQRELEWVARRQIDYVIGADANFGIKSRDLQLAKYLAHLQRQFGYPREFFINWTKNACERTLEIAEVLYEAGLQPVITLSIQSNDPATLRAIRRDNIRVDTFRTLKKEYGRRGIPTYTDILLGLPGETYDSFCLGLLGSLSAAPGDHLTINPVIMLENAEMAEKEYRTRYALQTRKIRAGMWRRVVEDALIPEEEEIVVGTSTMSQDEWRRAFTFAYFLQALHDLKLAPCLTSFLHFHTDVSLKSWLEYVVGHVGSDEPCCQRVLLHMRATQDAILEGREQVLPVARFERVRWQCGDACYLLACGDSGAFYSELGLLTFRYLEESNRAELWPMVKEIIEYQEYLLPTSYVGPARRARFEWDWPSFFRSLAIGDSCLPCRKAVEVEFALPSALQGADWRAIAVANLDECTCGKGLQMEVTYV